MYGLVDVWTLPDIQKYDLERQATKNMFQVSARKQNNIEIVLLKFFLLYILGVIVLPSNLFSLNLITNYTNRCSSININQIYLYFLLSFLRITSVA